MAGSKPLTIRIETNGARAVQFEAARRGMSVQELFALWVRHHVERVKRKMPHVETVDA